MALSSLLFTVGRHPNNNLCLDNPTVSGCHAEMVCIQDDVFVRDLNSTNGTFLNGQCVQDMVGVRNGDIVQFGNAMFTIRQQSGQSANATVAADVAHEAIAHLQFEKLLNQPAVIPFFQPIVRLDDLQCVGYEVLARREIMGLETPDRMFRVATDHCSEVELSCVCRQQGLRLGRTLDIETSIYLNTHPLELETSELIDSLRELREDSPDLPIVLEIHESGVTSTRYLAELRETLNELGMQLAYDDFGAGQARLMELVEVPPEVIKFDIKLIQGLSTASPQRLTTIGSLVQIVRDLGVVPLAEGVETQEDAAVCRDLGFDLAQGYLFGRPVPAPL